MASWPTLDGALLLLLLLLLSVRLLRRPTYTRPSAARSVVLLGLISAILAISVVDKDVEMAELEQLKLQLVRLETILEEKTKTMESKFLHLEENSMLVEEMEHKIQKLQKALDDTKTSTGLQYSEDLVNFMEQEVRKLWDESRKNNFHIHDLESKAYDAEEKLEGVAFEVQKMENIVTEQWIQIRQLEQALQMTKMMASKVHKKSTSEVHKKSMPISCTLLKFMKKLHHCYQPEIPGIPDSFFLGKSVSSSFIFKAFDLFRGILSSTRRCHHEVQGIVRQAMEMNEYTAALVNNEVIFFLASAVIIFPIMFIIFWWEPKQ